MRPEYYFIIAIIAYLIINIFLAINKSQKRQKAFMEMQSQLSVGSKIIFSNGLKGEVINLEKEEMLVKCGQAILKADRACLQMIEK